MRSKRISLYVEIIICLEFSSREEKDDLGGGQRSISSIAIAGTVNVNVAW